MGKLTATRLRTLTVAGMYGDGDGLYLKIGRGAGALWKRGSEWCGPCPLCGGKDRFHVRVADGRALVGCRGCIDGRLEEDRMMQYCSAPQRPSKRMLANSGTCCAYLTRMPNSCSDAKTLGAGRAPNKRCHSSRER